MMDELIRRWNYSAATNEWVCRVPADLFPELVRRIQDPKPPPPIPVLAAGLKASRRGLVLDRAAVVGLVGLLDDCEERLRKLASAYKGPTTRHAPGLARKCKQTAELLRAILGTENN
jgi:hypothetical protein